MPESEVTLKTPLVAIPNAVERVFGRTNLVFIAAARYAESGLRVDYNWFVGRLMTAPWEMQRRVWAELDSGLKSETISDL